MYRAKAITSLALVKNVFHDISSRECKSSKRNANCTQLSGITWCVPVISILFHLARSFPLVLHRNPINFSVKMLVSSELT